MNENMILSETVKADLFRHATEEYPRECCGVITGNDHVQRLHRLINIQDRLHALDPGSHPRTAAAAYAVDRREAEAVFASAAERGERVLAFYHSHVDCDAYFSRTDREAQAAFGEPEFPDAVQIVLSVKKGSVQTIKEFAWDRATGGFSEI